MPSNLSHVRKSRLIVLISVSLFFIGIASTVLILSEHTESIIEREIKEAENDLVFLSDLLKKSYIKKDFVGIEQILAEWVNNNKLDYSLHVVAANGYEIFSHINNTPVTHHKKLSRKTSYHGRHLFTAYLERDLGTVVSEAEQVRNNFIITGIGFGFIIGAITWILLYKLAFKPLENEISLRILAEAALKNINEELESRVEERTQAIKILSSVVEQTDDIVIITDPNGIVEYVNPSFEKSTGHPATEVIGNNLDVIKSGKHNESFYQKLWRTISSGKSFREIFINQKKSGDIYYEEKTITPLKDKNGKIRNFVSTGKDISDRMEIQEKLHYMASHDALTDLPNKIMILDRLSHAIDQAKRNKLKIAVMFLDLDQFKHVNDSLGHPTGDALLKNVSLKLEECVRKGDTIGRFGGDEFTIIMEGLKDTNDVNMVAQKILDTISEPIVIDGYEIITTTSIGITLCPDDSENADTLLKNADVAMYRAKSNGGNTFQFYTYDMSESAIERMELQHRLNHALDRNEFLLHYQPRINIKTGEITGMEALIRWDNPDIGFQWPDKFIPILEETGMIVEVGNWVIRTACQFNADLVKKGIQPLRVSVNLSARQIHDENLIQNLEDTFKQSNLSPQYLELEITESLLVDNIDKMISILDKLHQFGIHVSIDDFGTGYSSMSYLKNFPIDSLKIDRSFVNGLPDDKNDIAIVNAILALGKSLDIKLIAEGVESEEQKIFFQNHVCDEIQGYYYSKPLPGDEFISFLEKFNGNPALSKS